MTHKKRFYFSIGIILFIFLLLLYNISYSNKPLRNFNIQDIEYVRWYPGNNYLSQEHTEYIFQELKKIRATKKPVQENDIIGQVILDIRYKDGTSEFISVYEYMYVYKDVIYETKQNLYSILYTYELESEYY